jgi:signal transduction histidine kinase
MAGADPTSADAGLAGQLAPEQRAALTAVARVARALVGSGSFDELAAEALTEMRKALDVQLAVIYLPVPGASALERHAVSTARGAAWRSRATVQFDAEAWRLAVSGVPLVFHEQASWLQANPFEPPAESWLVLPLTREPALLGVLAAAARDPIVITPTEGIVLSLLGDLLSAGLATARLRQELHRVEVERERMRLAAQIHDGLAQDLSLAVRELALLESEPVDEVAAASRRRLRDAVTAAHALVRTRLREFSAPSPLGGLVPAVEEVCRRFERRGLRLALRVGDGLPELAPAVVAVAVRVLDEALANVERHAGASGATVALARDERELVLEVGDDGTGIASGALAAAAADGHLGVSLMHERARAVGGRLDVRSRQREGTEVILRLPLDRE